MGSTMLRDVVTRFSPISDKATRRKVAVLAAVASGALALAGCSGDSSSSSASSGCSVTVGVVGIFSGATRDYGNYEYKSAQLALSKFKPSRLNCHVTLKKYDAQGVPAKTTPVATAAARDSSVVAVVGPVFSGPTEVAGPIFNSAGLPMVTAVASAIDLSQHGWKVFHRTVESDAIDGAGDSYYIAHYLKPQSVAVVDNGEAYGQGVANEVKQGLDQAGVNVVADISIDPTASDYSSSVLQIKGSGANVVYCGCLAPEGARFAKQLRAGGVTGATFMGPAGIETENYLQVAGKAAEGTLATVAAPSSKASKSIRAIEHSFQAKFGLPPVAGYFVAQWYDATDAILRAIAAGNHTRSGINAFLSKVNFQGASGRIKFDSHGNVVGRTQSIYQVKNGKFEFLRQYVVPR